MAYEVEINQHLGLAVCTMWGVVWVEERHAALDEVLAHLSPGRAYSILVDMIGASCANESLDASGAFAQRLAGERALRDCRIAYLYPDGARVNHAVERLAEARDFRFRRFATTSDALDWLLAPPARIKPMPALRNVEPDAMTLLAGLRAARQVA